MMRTSGDIFRHTIYLLSLVAIAFIFSELRRKKAPNDQANILLRLALFSLGSFFVPEPTWLGGGGGGAN